MYILFFKQHVVCQLLFWRNEDMLLLNTEIPLTPKAVYVLSSFFVFPFLFLIVWLGFGCFLINPTLQVCNGIHFLSSIAKGEREFFCQEFEAHQ